MKKIIIIIAITTLLLPLVLSFSLRTGIKIIYFEPGLKTTVSFVIDNYDGPTKLFKLETVSPSEVFSGILDSVVYLREPEVTIKEGEQYTFDVDLTLPDSLPYGTHEINILIFGDENTQMQKGMIMIRKALAFRIIIYSLYPGKRLEGSLSTPSSANIGEILYFKTTVRNLGTEDVENARTKVDIYRDDAIVGTVYSESKPIASKDTTELVANLLITNDYQIGEHTAKAFLEYDGKTEDLASVVRFNIGALSVDILNITSRKFENNKINKFDIVVESNWNKPADVYADVIITNFSEVEKAKFKTQTVTIEGWKQGVIPAYMDIKDIGNDNYMLKIMLHYEEKTSRRTFAVEVSDKGEAEVVEEMPSTPKESLIIILLSVVIVLLIIIVLIMFFRRRKATYMPYNEVR